MRLHMVHYLSMYCFTMLCSCSALVTIDPPGIVVEVDTDTARFAVIGDYGKAGPDADAVAVLVNGWQPDFIITTGDNNYEYGDYSTLEENIGQLYGDYIYNYDAPGDYQCFGKAFQDSINRFFPSPGNHDGAGARGLQPYLNYFTLPGQEEYYTFSWGAAAFFSINSLSWADLEIQRSWLEKELASCEKKFRIVYFHHPPYSPGSHGDTYYMQWDFHSLGVDVVISGHDHIYSRLVTGGEYGTHYIINGLGGKSIYTCDGENLDPVAEPLVCFNESYGAMHCMITEDRLEMAFFSVLDPGNAVDRLVIEK